MTSLPIDVSSPDQAMALVDARGLDHIKIGLFDLDGILRGKLVSKNKFASALKKGFGFCDVVLGWDSDDQLYDNVTYTGWHTGYPDALARLLPETTRTIPFEFDGKGLFVLAEFAEAAETLCPRAILRRVLNDADAMGYRVTAGFEYEFFLFNETPHSVRDKSYNDLRPMTPGNFGYSVLRAATEHDIYHDLLATTTAMDIPLEGLHTETGPGVLEACLEKDAGLATADKAALFKTFTKVIAQRHGLMATFMAKWSPDYPGQSGHLHVSLQDKMSGEPVFYDSGDSDGISETQRHFIGGQQKLMPEFLALIAPTVNSYTRLIPGFWAPTDATWGVENRTCALRVVRGDGAAQRVEFRIGAADANPYLVEAAAVASGLYGIRHKVEPAKPIRGNAYEQKHAARLALPRTLGQAATRFQASAAAKDAFGEAFVSHFANSRFWEEREFQRAITDWELKRYFEII